MPSSCATGRDLSLLLVDADRALYRARRNAATAWRRHRRRWSRRALGRRCGFPPKSAGRRRCPQHPHDAAQRLFSVDAFLKAGGSPRTIFEALKVGHSYIDTLEKDYNPASFACRPAAASQAASGRAAGQKLRAVSRRPIQPPVSSRPIQPPVSRRPIRRPVNRRPIPPPMSRCPIPRVPDILRLAT